MKRQTTLRFNSQQSYQRPELRKFAIEVFEAAVQAADPQSAVTRALQKHELPGPTSQGRTLVIGVGKAAPGMMNALLGHVSGKSASICVTHKENQETVPGAIMFHAGHPVPDGVGLQASQAVIALLKGANKEDTVVALISGGGSALLPAPVAGISLSDKMQVNQFLLESGLDIVRMNLVRQQLSCLKGGGMLRFAATAKEVTGFILSDVIGDDMRAIASGPTVSPIGSKAEAVDICKQAGIWERLPQSAKDHFHKTREQKTPTIPVRNHLIGSNEISLRAAEKTSSNAMKTVVDSVPVIGDVRDAAKRIVCKVVDSGCQQPTAFLFGGETTVFLKGSGKGGRNQELALHVANLARQAKLNGSWVFLSGGTDGRDGPTEAAGGLVDDTTLERLDAAGENWQNLLEQNDSYAILASSEDLLVTGATGTNVADIQIFLYWPS